MLKGKLHPQHGSDPLWGTNPAEARPLRSAPAVITAGGREGWGPVSTRTTAWSREGGRAGQGLPRGSGPLLWSPGRPTWGGYWR